MTEHLTPAQVVEHMIGPPEVVGPAIGVDRTTLYQWLRPSKHRDAGDIPSARNMRRLLAYAAARGIPLRADHLIFGAHRTEIEALMKTPRPPMPPAIPAPARPEAAA